MSLLNDMLHDLAKQNTTPQISPRLKAVSAVRRHRNKLPITQISLMAVWGAFFITLLITLSNHNNYNAAETPAPQEILQTAIEVQTPAPVVIPQTVKAPTEEVNAQAMKPVEENILEKKNLTIDSTLAPAPVEEVAELITLPEPQETVKPVETLPAQQANVNPDIDVPEWLLSYIEPLANASNQWVNLNSETEDLAEDISTTLVNKVYAPLSLEEWHDLQMNKVLSAIDEGADARAAELLKTILIKIPQSVDARESLASIHLNNGNLADASAIIQQGLAYTPANPSLLTIKARIFLEQGRSQEAIALLSRHHPSLSRFPDFYGTLAAAFQSEGRITDAGSLYKALLQVEPDNSQYWLGYGMALEYSNKKNQAIEAYNRVTQGFEGDPAVRDYAENRLKTLQG